MTVLHLPIPPSANNLFPTGKHGKRFISPEYDAWQTQAGYELNQQRSPRHAGKVEVSYEYGRFQDNRRRDIGNLEKAPTDLLVKHGIIEDDCLIQRITLAWSDELPQGRMRVTITDWTKP